MTTRLMQPGGGFMGQFWARSDPLGTGVPLIHLKIYLFFQVLCSMFAPESHHIWIKLLHLTLFLAKVFFLSIFAGNKIKEKYHAGFSPKQGAWDLESHEGAMRPERAQ